MQDTTWWECNCSCSIQFRQKMMMTASCLQLTGSQSTCQSPLLKICPDHFLVHAPCLNCKYKPPALWPTWQATSPLGNMTSHRPFGQHKPLALRATWQATSPLGNMTSHRPFGQHHKPPVLWPMWQATPVYGQHDKPSALWATWQATGPLGNMTRHPPWQHDKPPALWATWQATGLWGNMTSH